MAISERTSGRMLAAILMVALILVGCTAGSTTTSSPAAGTPSPSSSAPEPSSTAPSESPSAATGPMEKVTVNLSFTYNPVAWYTLYDYAIEKGYFARNNLEVELVEGTGSANVVQVIANGGADFGAGIDTQVIIRAVNQGAPLVAVAVEHPQSGISVLSRGDTPIATPQDLPGKKIGFAPGSYGSIIFPTLLAANDIDPASVTIINVAPPAYLPSLASKTIDGYISSWENNLPVLEKEGLNPVALKFSDFGIGYKPSEVTIVTRDTASQRPDTVRRFLLAMNEMYNDVIDGGDAAIQEMAEIAVRNHPAALQVDTTVRILTTHLDLVRQQRDTRGAAFASETADWQANVDLMVKYLDLEAPQPGDAYFTNEFVPNE